MQSANDPLTNGVKGTEKEEGMEWGGPTLLFMNITYNRNYIISFLCHLMPFKSTFMVAVILSDMSMCQKLRCKKKKFTVV